MTDAYYKKAFQSAVKELSTLLKQREDLRKQVDAFDERIEKVRQGAFSLASLADVEFQAIKEKYPDLFRDDLDPRIGITEAVRGALRSANMLLTPTKIRDEVFKINPAIAGHKNPMASIHAVIRRLVESGDVVTGLDDEDRTSYGWLSPDDDEAKAQIEEWFTEPEVVWDTIKQRRKKKE